MNANPREAGAAPSHETMPGEEPDTKPAGALVLGQARGLNVELENFPNEGQIGNVSRETSASIPDSARRIVVTIAGEPVSQGRPRFARIGKFTRAYDPRKSRDWKAYAVACVEGALLARGITGIAFPAGPLKVVVLAVFTCPKGDHRKAPVARRLHAKRPDAENVGKAVLDSFTTAGAWQDDAQVADLRIVKFVGAQGEAPFVRVEVEAL